MAERLSSQEEASSGIVLAHSANQASFPELHAVPACSTEGCAGLPVSGAAPGAADAWETSGVGAACGCEVTVVAEEGVAAGAKVVLAVGVGFANSIAGERPPEDE
jgi:hypothetical protein